MTLSERLSELVRAAFGGIYVRSFEPDDAIVEIARLCRGNGWALGTWDIDRGLALTGQPAEPAAIPGATDPLAAIRALNSLASPDGTAMLVLRNLHRFLGSAEIVQALDTQVVAGKQSRAIVVILSPVVQLPVELEKLFVVVEHELPGRDQIEAIARGIATEPGELPEEDDRERLIDAAAGMTRMEAENAFSLSLVCHGRLAPDVIWELKVQALKKSGLLELHRAGETFATPGGLEALKGFCTRALRRNAGRRARPRGVLLLGVPGSGKSQFAKSLGTEVGRPTIALDLGALKGSLVGQTEERTRLALAQIDAMQPCVVFADEIEKGLAGVRSSGQTDGGVSAGQFGTLIRWMNDHTSDAFLVMTANDIAKLPPEFTRCERIDAVFFVDLPSTPETEAIWQIHLRTHDLDPDQRRPRDVHWTDAEIKACCRLADLLGIPLIEAAQLIVPVAITAGESIERLRAWAGGRCLSAERPGLYTRGTEATGKAGRNVRRDPSSN